MPIAATFFTFDIHQSVISNYYSYLNSVLYELNSRFKFYGQEDNISFSGLEDVLGYYFNYGHQKNIIPTNKSYYIFLKNLMDENNVFNRNWSMRLYKYETIYYDSLTASKSYNSFRIKKKYVKNLSLLKPNIKPKNNYMKSKKNKTKTRYTKYGKFGRDLKRTGNKNIRNDWKHKLKANHWDSYSHPIKQEFSDLWSYS